MGEAARFRMVAAAVSVAFLAVAAALNYYEIASQSVPDRYGIGAQQQRFHPVASVLPPGAVVGYISDLSPDDARGSAAFFAAQYHLAPRILVPFPAERPVDWVLGNFSRPTDLDDVSRRHHLVLVRDFGRGVMIFRRAGTSSR
ncbi:MAG: hypothetical protein RMK57_10510 [Bryobacterales bacterium]|nr:hypothetical protein [Bryobacteraceae bacterium]MDW8354948.1 hypothetical protein [Bryobacterales bacterium]